MEGRLVLIPSNRVMQSESVLEHHVPSPEKVLIPSNRVMQSEVALSLFRSTAIGLNPLESGHAV